LKENFSPKARPDFYEQVSLSIYWKPIFIVPDQLDRIPRHRTPSSIQDLAHSSKDTLPTFSVWRSPSPYPPPAPPIPPSYSSPSLDISPPPDQFPGFQINLTFGLIYSRNPMSYVGTFKPRANSPLPPRLSSPSVRFHQALPKFLTPHDFLLRFPSPLFPSFQTSPKMAPSSLGNTQEPCLCVRAAPFLSSLPLSKLRHSTSNT